MAIAAALALGAPCLKSHAETIDGESFGLTRVVAPERTPLGFVALFSDEAGWTAEDDRTLTEMAAQGALAVGIDTKIYLQNLQANRKAAPKADCVDFFKDIQGLSRRVQGRHPSLFYNKPVVAGLGEGGAIAYAALAQSEAAAFSAAISVDPRPTLDISRPLCRLEAFAQDATGNDTLGAVTKLNGDFQAAFDDRATPGGRASVEALARTGVPVEILSMTGTDSAQSIEVLIKHRIEIAAKQGVDSLPLVELPVNGPARAMVIFISGDGGWRDLDKTMGEKLQALGIPVVGWDSLRYFWSRKTPEQTCGDLAAIMTYYGAKWRADKVVLVGYSFGANLMPIVYNLLPAAYRDRIPMISLLYPDSFRRREKGLAFGGFPDSDALMIRSGFLSKEDRDALLALARDNLSAGRVTRRANALVLLDDGMSCEEVARVLLFDDDTIRDWYRLFELGGLEGLTCFDVGGSSSLLSTEQALALKAWVTSTLPRSTRHVGAWIKKEFGLVYESRSGLIALLHRLGLEYHKPEVIPRKLDEEKQKAFIAAYEKLLNSLGDDEVVLFGDAVHPTHAARPVGCWAPKEHKLAIEQTSGRERINIHGAVDLETGQTRMIEADTVNAISTIQLLESLEALYPLMVCIHVFLDNARYHHAKLVSEWLSRPGCRIKLHFLPAYCPHLNPIERLWGVMHKNVTHNKCHDTRGEFAEATLHFLRVEVPRKWAEFRSTVTDNFRIISPKAFRLVG